MEVVIVKSTKKEFDALIHGKKTLSFGDSNYSGFTRHKDLHGRDSYVARRSKEDWVSQI